MRTGPKSFSLDILISRYNIVMAVRRSTSIGATRVWLVLWKASKAVEQNALRSIAALGLGLSDFALLEVLLHKGPLPVNAIGRRVLLTSGSMTTAVDRLEARNLVRKSIDPEDLRSRIVQLTATGRRLITAAFKKHERDLEQTMAVLNTQERATLVRLLKKMGIPAAARASS